MDVVVYRLEAHDAQEMVEGCELDVVWMISLYGSLLCVR